MKSVVYTKFIMFLLVASCKTNCEINGIKVDELLYSVSYNKSIYYCELLELALNGDDEAIKEISLLEFYNAVAYEHGIIVVELILHIGENNYIKAIEGLNEKQKHLVEAYVNIGLEYGVNSRINNKEINKQFPKLDLFLKN
ncbi:hypothetical protein AB4865_11555 [Capnocytophaga sp. ARDL2]|uniref:hypothetical protein n=1 Tax=Capnocytophaga sp. ARDL2 TaxID=3238809 RepID=UPI0035590330